MYVETDFSRSYMASMYSGVTAPALTRISPASRMDSSLLRAVPGTLIWDSVKTSLMARQLLCRSGSARRGTAARSVGDLQLFDDRVVLGAVHEVVHGHVLSTRRHVPRPWGEVLVGHDQVDVV